MYDPQDIRSVHLEITTKCNASCPQCGRNWKGGILRPFLPMVEMSLDDAKIIFPPSFIKQLTLLYACGNFGDCIVARDTLEIFRYFRQHNSELELQIHTNGSARKGEWWANMAEVLGDKGSIFFGIDGLEDTNHIYRRRTSWNIIMRNANAFIQSGGHASWQFIVFKHNEHQVKEAEALAYEMGFEEFFAKKTGRFYDHTNGEVTDHFAVRDEEGTELYRLEPPTNPDHQNASLLNIPMLIDNFGSMTDYFKATPITCRYQEEKRIYVTAEGHVLPCCWTHNQLFNQSQQYSQMHKLVDDVGGKDTLDGTKHSIGDIVKRLHHQMPDHWKSNDDRFIVCGRRCGTAFDQCNDGRKPDGFRRDGIGG